MAYSESLLLEKAQNAGPATARTSQAKYKDWPEGTVLISADSHMLESDMWLDKFPDHLKDRAPRVLFQNGGWELRFANEMNEAPIDNKPMCELTECYDGFSQLEARIRDLDNEGIAKELLFPQKLWSRNMAGDIDMREWVFPIYNEHMAETCAKAPGRLYFNAVPNYWDNTQTRKSVEQIKSLGATAILIPNDGRLNSEGNKIMWGHPNMQPFWEAIEESGLPVCFHVGEGFPNPYPGAPLALALNNFHNHVPVWSQLVFGGVFDRHPGLRVVFVEAGFGWVAKALHDADLIWSTYQPVTEYRSKHMPSWYWHNHCYATFMVDPVGFRTLDMVGVDRIMWSTDYPHAESTLGYTQDAIEAVFNATSSVEDAQKILGLNALKLFNMG